jgi:hypothetical protein
MKSRKVKWAGRVVHVKDMRTECDILFGESERKKLLERHKGGQKYDVKMYLKVTEIDWNDVDWSKHFWDTHHSTVHSSNTLEPEPPLYHQGTSPSASPSLHRKPSFCDPRSREYTSS